MTSTAPLTRSKETMASTLIKLVSNSFWEVADYSAFKSTRAARLYDKTIGGDYKEEYDRCGITTGSNILHIGCGSYPLTEIALAKTSKAHITGIDKNTKAIPRALKIITERGLSDCISIEQGDGCTFPISTYNTIIVSSCSQPKISILQHIHEQAPSKARIIVREVDIACPYIEAFLATHPSLVVTGRIHHNPFPFVYPVGWTTYQLHKQ